jgi:F5/8 type C domain
VRLLLSVLLILLPCVATAAEATTTSANPSTGLVNHAKGAAVFLSSHQMVEPGEGPPEELVDGNDSTRASTGYLDNQSIELDLGRLRTIDRVVLQWEENSANRWSLLVSEDGQTWKPGCEERRDGKAGVRTDIIPLAQTRCRFLKLVLTERTTAMGFSLYEIEAFGPP